MTCLIKNNKCIWKTHKTSGHTISILNNFVGILAIALALANYFAIFFVINDNVLQPTHTTIDKTQLCHDLKPMCDQMTDFNVTFGCPDCNSTDFDLERCFEFSRNFCNVYDNSSQCFNVYSTHGKTACNEIKEIDNKNEKLGEDRKIIQLVWFIFGWMGSMIIALIIYSIWGTLVYTCYRMGECPKCHNPIRVDFLADEKGNDWFVERYFTG